jgi:hybrid cluster-associated redox disulfide protein
MIQQVTKDMIIADLLKIDEEIAAILIQNGMGCIFCPASQGESLEEACFVHGMNPDEIMEDINDYLAQKAEDMAPDESQIITEE